MLSIKELFRTKSIEQLKETAEKKSLKRTLSALDILAMGIGAIIGTGIFVLTGVAAALHAGPAIVVSFIISGFACMLIALVYSELASMVPVAGSAYTYSYAAIGEIVAWIVGWDLILEYGMSICVVSAGWSGYVTSLLNTGGINLPLMLTATPSNGGLINLPAMLIPLFLGFLLVLGTKESATFTKIVVVFKLAAIFIFVFLAVPKFNAANWSNFMPYGYSGILSGAAIIFIAYLGFDSLSTTAEECRNPQKDLPIGILGSLLVCTIIYVIVSAVLTGIIPYQQLNIADPLSYALTSIGHRLGSAIVACGAIAGITTVLLLDIYGQTRIVFSMSRDGFLPQGLGKLHPKFRTPYIITIITTAAAAVIAGIIPIDILANLVNIGTLFAFILSAIGVLVLRYKRPDINRPFKSPAIHIVVPLAVIMCAILLLTLSVETWLRFIIWFFVGIAIYFAYGRRHSVLGREKAKEEVVMMEGARKEKV